MGTPVRIKDFKIKKKKNTCPIKNQKQKQQQQKTEHGTMDWLKFGKGVHQGCILSSCLFNLYAEYIIQNAELDEAQAESRLPREISINSDMHDTTLMAESEEEIKSLLMK